MQDLSMFLLFLVVSVTVSIDVVGLSFSKASSFAKETTTQHILWGVYNGLWHSLLLLFYLGVIEFTISFLFFDVFMVEIKAFVHWITSLIGSFLSLIFFFVEFNVTFTDAVDQLFDIIKTHLVVIVGTIAMIVVWQIYADKTVSTPADSAGDDVDELPAIAAIAFLALELGVKFYLFILNKIFRKADAKTAAVDARRFLFRNFQAALVAVDMLALAIILKSLGYIGDGSKMGLQNQSGDPFIIGLIIFIVVALLAFVTAHLGGRKFGRLEASLGKDKNQGAVLVEGGPLLDDQVAIAKPSSEQSMLDFIKIFLRIAEPFLIFYFVMQLLVVLIHGKVEHSVGLMFGSALFVIALFTRHSFHDVVEAALADDDKGTDGELEIRKLDQLGDPFGRMIIKVLWVLAGLCATLICLALLLALLNFVLPTYFGTYWSHLAGDEDKLTSLDSLILSFFIFYVLFIRRFNLLFPDYFKKLDRQIYETLTRLALPAIFIGLSFLVALSVPIFQEVAVSSMMDFADMKELYSFELSTLHATLTGFIDAAFPDSTTGARFHAIQFSLILAGVSAFILIAKNWLDYGKSETIPERFFLLLAFVMFGFALISQFALERVLG